MIMNDPLDFILKLLFQVLFTCWSCMIISTLFYEGRIQEGTLHKPMNIWTMAD